MQKQRLTRARLTPVVAAKSHEAAFLVAARASRSLHGRWVRPPATASAFRTMCRRWSDPDIVGRLLVDADNGALLGVVELSGIHRGLLQSGYLGYYALAPHAARGHMTAGLVQFIDAAFRRHGLHRIEANIQPGNERSRALAQRLGFRLEGYSPRYLKIRGRWRDHERWALLREEWPAARAKAKEQAKARAKVVKRAG